MLVLAAWCLAIPARPIRAQTALGRITGIVVDSAGNPMANVAVLVFEQRRQVRTRADGTFRLDSLKVGNARISARAIGYVSAGLDVRVRVDSTPDVRLEMVQFAVVLPAMTSVASDLGLSGIIGDTAYRAILGAKVQVMGTGLFALTDSVGQFRIPLKPGAYMVRIEAKGYRGQAVGVRIPADSGRKISALLPPMQGMDAIEIMRQWNLGGLHERLLVASPVYNRVFTRDDLRALHIEDPVRAMAQLTADRINRDACAKINGGPAWAPLWSLQIDDIEFIEANLPRPARNTRRSLTGGATSGPISAGGSGAALPNVGAGMTCGYIAWLRQ